MRKIVILSAIALILVSCFDPWQGDGGSLSISIGSGGNGRSVVPVPGYDGKTSADLYHRITITDSSGTVHEGGLKPDNGDKKDFFSLALGPCTIRVEGFLDEGFTERVSIIKEDSEDIKDGIKTITIKAGVNPVYITMKFIDEEGGYDLPLIPGLYEGAPKDLNAESTPIEYALQNNVERAFSFLREATGTYTLLIGEGEHEATSQTLDREGVNLIIMGIEGECIIKLSGNGSLFTVSNGVILTLENITLQGHDGNTGPLVAVNKGKLVMNAGAKITGNHDTTVNSSPSSAGGVIVFQNGEFIMNGGEISNNSTTSQRGGGVNISGGSFTMKNSAKITGNKATGNNSDGGGVYVSGGGTFTMEGGVIGGENPNESNTAARDGGGVFVSGPYTFTMSNNSKISGNTAAQRGGGVYVSYGTFNMNSGTIYSNQAAQNGGGVYVTGDVSYPGTFTMKNDAKISGNRVTGNNSDGGGVYVISYASFTMEGGVIGGENPNESNTATRNGGGVYVNVNVNEVGFIMNGGTISGNTTTENGGGVYVNNGAFLMGYYGTSAVISGNSAQYGGGVYVVSGNEDSPGLIISNGTIYGNEIGVPDADKNKATYGAALWNSGHAQYGNGYRIIKEQTEADGTNNTIQARDHGAYP